MKNDIQLLHGDCLERLKELPNNSVDSIVTDPPYGLSFMGKKWDYDVPSVEVWAECLRVLKPGGHLLAFAGTRTQHRMAVRIEDAGFEIRDMIAWVYGSGFPKSLNIGKAVDKLQGNEREAVGIAKGAGAGMSDNLVAINKGLRPEYEATKGTSPHEGWGTALKPALEPITVARKPLEGTVAANVLQWGTGGLNVDGCRVEVDPADPVNSATYHAKPSVAYGKFASKETGEARSMAPPPAGRWPANLIHDGSEEVVGLFPGVGKGNGKGSYSYSGAEYNNKETSMFNGDKPQSPSNYNDSGSAARFFYCAKASKKDRNEGLDSSRTVKHPTGLCKEENMALAQSLQKVTSELTVTWSIDESGENITGLCQLDSLSTMLTEISKITTSQICNLWMRLPTRESIVDVKLGMENGGSRVENVEKLKESQQITTIENQVESVHGASSVVSKMLLSISDVENWKPSTNFHATVKPTDLMRYLCRLVTPPGGIVLDPFMGSGSTGKAASLEGFQFIGIEREAEYMEIAKARIEAAKTLV